MDIRLKMAAGNFTLRAAALILRDGRLLVAKHDDYDCFYTIGGGIKLGETSEEAVMREVFEETGARLTVERLIFVQERFFALNRKNYHEVTFFYLMDGRTLSVADGQCTDQQEEHLYWLPVTDLSQVKLVPAFLRESLQMIPEKPVHMVSKEA